MKLIDITNIQDKFRRDIFHQSKKWSNTSKYFARKWHGEHDPNDTTTTIETNRFNINNMDKKQVIMVKY